MVERYRVTTEFFIVPEFNFNDAVEKRAGRDHQRRLAFLLPGRKSRHPTLERRLRQYKAGVRLDYETIVRDCDIAKERRSSFGLRLMQGLSYEAWDAVEPLFSEVDPQKKDGGHHLLLAAALEKLDEAWPRLDRPHLREGATAE